MVLNYLPYVNTVCIGRTLYSSTPDLTVGMPNVRFALLQHGRELLECQHAIAKIVGSSSTSNNNFCYESHECSIHSLFTLFLPLESFEINKNVMSTSSAL